MSEIGVSFSIKNSMGALFLRTRSRDSSNARSHKTQAFRYISLLFTAAKPTMMMSQQPMDIPTTIFCRLDEVEQSEDFTMDDLCSSVRSSISDCNHLDLSRKSSTNTTTSSPYDNRVVTNQDLRNMKDMVASMRQNPELLNISPVMQRACLTSNSNHRQRQRQRRCTTDGIPPRLIVPDRHGNEDDAVKNEDLNAMKHMVASMRKNPLLLYQSPIMQRACLTTTNTTTSVDNTAALTTTNNDISPKPISPVELPAAWSNSSTNVGRRRRPLGGTRYDPSTFPSLPLPSVPMSRRGVHSIVDNAKVPSSAVAPAPAATFVAPSLSREAIKMDAANTLSRFYRPRSI
jgi:hypothetical protein